MITEGYVELDMPMMQGTMRVTRGFCRNVMGLNPGLEMNFPTTRSGQDHFPVPAWVMQAEIARRGFDAPEWTLIA